MAKIHTVALLACMVVPLYMQAEGAITCSQVRDYLMPCIPDILGGGNSVSASCCDGIKDLQNAATTTGDRRTACGCLKSAAESIPGVNTSNAAKILDHCGVNLPYKISKSTNCDKIH